MNTVSKRRPVLLVGADNDAKPTRTEALARAGFSVHTFDGFLGAREALTELKPDAIITDAELGDYTGLHLVATAQVAHPRMACLVLGPRDPALQTEAYHLGARYLVEPVDPPRMLAVLTELLANPRPQRRWPRRRPAADVSALVSGIHARVVDVSYGGAHIEFVGKDIPNGALELTVPGTGVAVPVERVWTRRQGKTQPTSCGLALRRNGAVDARWRSFVDNLELLPGNAPPSGGSGLAM